MRSYNSAADTVLGSPLRNLFLVLGFVFSVCVVSVIAYRVAGWSWSDAVYMVTLTIYTVGYQEVRPIDTPYLHFVTIGTIVTGCTGMIILTGVLVQVFTEFQIKRVLGFDRMKSQIEKLKDHVIICGYGRIGVMLAKDLSAGGSDFVIVERNPAKLGEVEAAGFLCITGDATEEATLETAGIARARVLATVLPDDAANVFITLTARSLNADVEIIARGEVPATENKLLNAGANSVVLPTHIGAERIAEMILFPETANFLSETDGIKDLKRGMSDFGLELEVVRAVADSALTGLSVIDAERQGGGAFFVVQLDKANGQTVPHPGPDIIIEPDDNVVLVVRAGRVAAGTKFSRPKGPVQAGRNMI